MTDGTKQHQTINFIRNITITTLNFNGLHDDRKKNTKNISNNTKQKKSYNPSETHSKPEQATQWEKELEGPSY